MKKFILFATSIIAILLITGFTNQDFSELLRLKTNQIKVLNQQIENLSLELFNIKQEIVQIKEERKEHKQILYTVEVLTEGAVASRWADPKHIKNVMSLCKKYEYLLKDLKEQEHNNWCMLMTRCIATGLNPNHRKDDDENGEWDNGIADLNDVCLKEIEKDMPEHIRRRSWYNKEKAIYGLCVWIKQRERDKMPWCVDVNKRQWDYYASIKHAK